MSEIKTILICNQKGGAGKSVCVDELAFSFERTGTPMSFCDFDLQGDTLHATREVKDAEVAVL